MLTSQLLKALHLREAALGLVVCADSRKAGRVMGSFWRMGVGMRCRGALPGWGRMNPFERR